MANVSKKSKEKNEELKKEPVTRKKKIKKEEISSDNEIKDKTEPEKKVIKKNDTPFGIFEVVSLVVITCIVSTIFGYFLKGVLYEKSEKYVAVDETLQEFITKYNEIVNDYYGDVSEKDLLEAALKAVLTEIDDKYTGVIDTENNALMASLDGEYQGVGLEIQNDKDYNVVVNKIFENSPASKVDIKKGDIITKVNQTPVDKLLTSQVTALISAQGDNEFTLELKRNGELFNVKLKRDKIIINSVAYSMIEENNAKIGYIKLELFAANSYQYFKDALTELEDKDMETLIVDLRDNTGGHLSVTKNIMDLFVDDSNIVYQTRKDEKTTKIYSSGKVTKNYPIVVLVNGESASASEMLTGMLKDNLDAYIIGTNTYGKGTVQDVKTFGDIQYKYTSKEWLTPKGTSINGVGIAPDLKVDLNDKYNENPTFENDNQLQKAIEYIIEKR